MFQRRAPLTRLQRLRTALWPQMGWKRAYQYLLYRIGRLPGSAYAIAGGFAWGAAMSFTPFIGLHILLSAFGAWMTRCSVVASVIGTVIGNPWTFPFIWIWLYKAGVAMGFGQTGIDAEAMDFSALFAQVTHATLNGDWRYLLEGALPLMTPMLVAAVPSAAVVWVTFFLLLKPVIERYKNGASVRREQRATQIIRQIGTEQESTP